MALKSVPFGSDPFFSGAHHSSDLFHVRHEVVKATGAPLARQERDAERAVARAQATLDEQEQARTAYWNAARRPPGRPPAFDDRIGRARDRLVEKELDHEQVQARRTLAREQVQAIGAAYHPYDLATGEAQSAEGVAQRLQGCWDKLTELARDADLPERCHRRLRKAQRVTDGLLATLAFFFMTIEAKIEALNLAPEIETVAYERLIPAIYLDQVADKTPDRAQRQQLRGRVASLLEPLGQPHGVLSRLGDDERQTLEQVARECAELFQRTGSYVEGRNGQPALHHHARRRLGNRKLAALTTVHNYYIQRPDGTTAAERFFGRKPPPPFDALLNAVPLPGRPRGTGPGGCQVRRHLHLRCGPARPRRLSRLLAPGAHRLGAGAGRRRAGRRGLGAVGGAVGVLPAAAPVGRRWLPPAGAGGPSITRRSRVECSATGRGCVVLCSIWAPGAISRCHAGETGQQPSRRA
jgi:hypothetical protein